MRFIRPDGVSSSVVKERIRVKSAKEQYTTTDHCFDYVTVESLLDYIEKLQKDRLYQLSCVMAPASKSRYKTVHRWVLRERFSTKAELARFVAGELKLSVGEAYDSVEAWSTEEITIGAMATLRTEA